MSEKKNKKTMGKLITEGFIKTCHIGDTGKVNIQIDPVSPYAVEYDEKCCLLAIASPKNRIKTMVLKKPSCLEMTVCLSGSVII